MIHIRQYAKEDNEAVSELNGLLALELMWHGGFHEENAFVAVDDDGNVVGISAMSYDATWYYIDKKRTDIEEYRLQFETVVREGIPDEITAYVELIERIKKRLAEIKEQYPDKKIGVRCFVYENKHDELEFMLSMGLSISQVILVLSYDLTGEIPTFPVSQGYHIGICDVRDNRMKDYLDANEAGYGVQDSEDELRFRLCVPTTEVITVEENSQVVASTTIWDIKDKHSATENVFTIPEARRKGLAGAVLSYALSYLKQMGKEEATLTVLGDNQPALQLYFGLGYTLKSSMYEVKYTI